MDTYENDPINPQSEEEQTTPMPEPLSDGFYHGTGAGTAETTYISPERQETEQTQGSDVEPPTEKPRRHIGMKIVKGAIAATVGIVLVITGCGISVGVMNYHWKRQYDLQLQHYQSCLDVLQEKLDRYENSNSTVVTVTKEGLTPSQIYEKNIASVVAINCTVTTTTMGQPMQSTSAGSGFVLTEDGYIVTNHHVVNGATKIKVNFADGVEMEAELIGSDSTNDIALLKIAANGLQPVTLGSSDDLAVGEQVVAIGNALGELSFSLTVGHVSGMDRDITTDGTVINMIQTDVAINSGNSGGPLFNSRGELVGITSAKYSGTTSSGASIEGISFAIPWDDVSGMLEDIRLYGYVKSAYLGVMVRNMDSTVAESYGLPLGVYVESVVAGGSAAKAGVRAKDIIINVGGHDIENMADLTRALREFEAGESSTIAVWRGGRELILKIVFDEKPQS